MTTTMRPSTGFFLFCCLGAGAVQGSLISLGNCQSDAPTGTLIVGFRDSCDHECAVSAMARSGVPADDAYNHLTSLNMITLGQYSPDNLASLRSDEHVDFIECDGVIGIADGNAEEAGMSVSNSIGGEVTETPLVKLSNCDSDVPTGTLIIGFEESCDNDCAVNVMVRLDVAEDAYKHLTSSNMIILRRHSPENLASLSSDENIRFIECDGVAGIAVGDPDEGEAGVSNSIGAEVTETPLVKLSNCDSDAPTGILIIGFQESCGYQCVLNVMARSGVPADDAYNHLTSSNMITLGQYSPDNLASLRSDEHVDFIECDGVIGIADENAEEGAMSVSNAIDGEVTETPLVKLSNCDSDVPTGALIIGFEESCDNDCAVNVMVRLGVAEDAYEHLTSSNMIILRRYSPENLASLSSDENVDFIECDVDDDSGSSCSRTWTPLVFAVAILFLG